MPDFLPRNDLELSNFLADFMTNVTANLTVWGLVSGDVTALAASITAYIASVTAEIAERDTLNLKINDRVTKKATAAGLVRPFIRRINNHPGMTDALRGILRIPVPDRVRSRSNVGPRSRLCRSS
jgi:hypothetical protein